ncbi:MAG: carbohydrate ABC transporter permease [Mycoplasmatales bacterium]
MNYKKNAYLFIAPAIILLLVFSVLPIFIATIVSLTDMDLTGLIDFSKINFIGITNYLELFKDREFIDAIKNTFFYVLIGVPLVIICSLTVAVMINAVSGKLGTFFRGIYYFPAITNSVAIAVVWLFLYNNSYGLFNYIIQTFGAEPIQWLNDPRWAKLALIVLAVWKGLGLNMIILLAAITAVPNELYEAAAIDGANTIQRFFKVTLPQLKYAIFFVVITTTIG